MVFGVCKRYGAYKGLADALKGKYSGIVDATKGVTGTYTTLLGMNVGLTTTNKSNQAIDTINAAINAVSSYRAKLGAAQNRLEHTINRSNL